MKMQEAVEIIEGVKAKGFMVHFERVDDGLLYADYFPDKHAGEELISTEEEAWKLARDFAAKTKRRCINIYVIDSMFSPVAGHKNKLIKNR